MTRLFFTGEQHSENFRTAADSNAQIKLKGNRYYAAEGKKRYML